MARITRRHFLYGTLLAGAIPRAGFGSVPSLKALGYQSPNEKLNIASIGAGGRPLGVLGGCETENIVALADVYWARAAQGFERYPNPPASGIPQISIARRDHRCVSSHSDQPRPADCA